MPSQMVDVVWVKPKRTVVVSEATRGSRRLALHRLRASLIGENGRLPQANSDAAQSLQWGTEDSRSQGGEEPAKKGRAGGKNGKTEASSSGMPRNKRISPAAARWMPAVLQEPFRASLIAESGRLAQANRDAAQSLQLGAEYSRSEGDEEIAKKGGAGGGTGKIETNSHALPRTKSQSKWICETGQLGSEQQARPAETGA
ncbi:uncharacterized protein LOC142584895 isoform X3 [Dermacentor variabilis]|uniref:uncharacterized protein LOC142584895 isoform X3 n=1 Tax=Dermacentor variabilis TaxID=34621 RepID=UPI003F5B0487